MNPQDARKRLAILGCGSIGSRYARIARGLGFHVAAVEVDATRRRALSAVVDDVFSTPLELIAWQPDYAIVATPPAQHAPAFRSIAALNVPVLVEKPIAHTRQAAEQIVGLAGGKEVSVVCNLRFHPAVATVKSNLHLVGKPLSYRAVFGHRLSQMRPRGGEFAASSSAGGGVLFDCIHEFDYVQWLFGEIVSGTAKLARLGDEVEDAEDIAQVLLQHKSSVRGSLHLDLLMREKRRGIEIYGTDATLSWTSYGKAPEACLVTLTTNDERTVLYANDDVDSDTQYSSMLRTFFSSPETLQDTKSAFATFSIVEALKLRQIYEADRNSTS